MNCRAVLSSVAIAMMCPSMCLAQSDYEVSNPFVDPVAQQHFQACYPETTQSELTDMKRIVSYSYSFDDIPGCPPGSNCNPALKFFRGRRTVKVKVDELNPNNVSAMASAQSSGGCSPTSVGSFSYSIARKVAQYSVHVTHEEKVCTFLGDLTLASGSADLVFGYNLLEDFSALPFQSVINESSDINIFGFLLGALGVAAIGGASIAMVAVVGTVATHKLFVAPSDSTNFLGAGIRGAGQFNAKPLDQLGAADLYKMEYATNVADSGFTLDGADASLEVYQDGYLSKVLEDGYKHFRGFEIEFIKSLPEIEPEKYTVGVGDNLWHLTEKRYGDGRLTHFVAMYNGMTRERNLKIGELVKFPRWYELCQRLKPKNLFVKERESLWSKAKAGQIPFDFRKVRHVSRDLNLIYPFEELSIAP